jgi:hypothetical protein
LLAALLHVPLQQEAAIAIYLLAIPVTLVLLGALIGLVVGLVLPRRGAEE